jgi:hypothetical protein
MEDVDNLLSQPIPLGKNTEKSSLALVGLRKLHASLTNGSTDSTGTDPLILNHLREEVTSKISFCVFKLARLVFIQKFYSKVCLYFSIVRMLTFFIW